MTPRPKKQKPTAGKTPASRNEIKSAINELSKTPSNTYVLNSVKYPKLEGFMKKYAGTWSDVTRAQLEGEVTASMAVKIPLGVRRANLIRPWVKAYADSRPGGKIPQKKPARASTRSSVPQSLGNFKICLTNEISDANINIFANKVFERLDQKSDQTSDSTAAFAEAVWPSIIAISRLTAVGEWLRCEERHIERLVEQTELDVVQEILETVLNRKVVTFHDYVKSTVGDDSNLTLTHVLQAQESVKDGPETGKHEALTVIECNKGSISKFVEKLKQERHVMYDSQAALERARKREGELARKSEQALYQALNLEIVDEESIVETVAEEPKDGPAVTGNFEGSDLAAQLIGYMVSYRLDHIFLTDGREYLLLYLDYSEYDRNSDKRADGDGDLASYTIIPMKWRHIDSWDKSEGMTPAALILSSCMNSADKDHREKRYQDVDRLKTELLNKLKAPPVSKKHNNGDGVNEGTSNAGNQGDDGRSQENAGKGHRTKKVIEDGTLGAEYQCGEPQKFRMLQKGPDFLTQVYEFHRADFENFFKCELTEFTKSKIDRLVVKAYDIPSIEEGFLQDDMNSLKDLKEYVRRTLRDYYKQEIRALHKIRSYNRRQVKQGSNGLINIPEFISAGDINVLYRNFETINWGYLVYGKFILNAYVEDHEECATKESLKKACTQVERLAQLGIYHGDIKRGNIRFTENGDVCLIDFSHCVIFNPKNKKKYEKYYSEMVEDFTDLFEEMGF
jgi:hypothetical protein